MNYSLSQFLHQRTIVCLGVVQQSIENQMELVKLVTLAVKLVMDLLSRNVKVVDVNQPTPRLYIILRTLTCSHAHKAVQ